jgi:hypothetical protein
MQSDDRPSTGVRARRRIASSPELTFPAALVHPPQSQVAQYEDAVSNRIGQLEVRALQLGEGFGIPFTSFVLNPLATPPLDTGLAVVASMLGALTTRPERISLERRNGRWGLYFTREPAVVAQERKADTVPLKDAPLDVRERFLVKSQEFFRSYLELCKDRLSSMKQSVHEADQTIALIDRLRLE